MANFAAGIDAWGASIRELQYAQARASGDLSAALMTVVGRDYLIGLRNDLVYSTPSWYDLRLPWETEPSWLHPLRKRRYRRTQERIRALEYAVGILDGPTRSFPWE